MYTYTHICLAIQDTKMGYSLTHKVFSQCHTNSTRALKCPVNSEINLRYLSPSWPNIKCQINRSGIQIYINLSNQDIAYAITLTDIWEYIFNKTQRLTHWGRDKMAVISQTTFSNAFSWMKMYEFRLRVHWSLFLSVQIKILHHWFR